ncbi:MAG: DUF3800 domain-containing protein [Candidatus Dormibacteria bacterium]
MFLSDLPSEWRSRRQVLALQVYVDDSGAKGQPSPMVLGGLLMAAEAWMAFTKDWRAELDRPPRVWRFKSYEAGGAKGSWRAMTEDERRSRLRGLARVLSCYKPRVIRTSVDVVSFAETIQPLVTHPLSDPYFFLFFDTIWTVASHLASEGQRERFEIIFDNQDVMAPKVKRWYPILNEIAQQLSIAGPHWSEAASILPIAPLFCTDDELIPLQAADLMAGALRGEMRSGFKLQWLRPELPPVTWAYDLDRQRLNQTIAGLGGSLAASLVDSGRYGQMLGLDENPGRLPNYLRPRYRAYHASRARTSPPAPQSHEPDQPEAPL